MPPGDRRLDRIYLTDIPLEGATSSQTSEALVEGRYRWVDMNYEIPLPNPELAVDQETGPLSIAYPHREESQMRLTEQNLISKTLTVDQARAMIHHESAKGLGQEMHSYADVVDLQMASALQGNPQNAQELEMEEAEREPRILAHVKNLVANEPQIMHPGFATELDQKGYIPSSLQQQIATVGRDLSRFSVPGFEGQDQRQIIIENLVNIGGYQTTFSDVQEDIEQRRQAEVQQRQNDSDGQLWARFSDDTNQYNLHDVRNTLARRRDSPMRPDEVTVDNFRYIPFAPEVMTPEKAQNVLMNMEAMYIGLSDHVSTRSDQHEATRAARANMQGINLATEHAQTQSGMVPESGVTQPGSVEQHQQSHAADRGLQPRQREGRGG